MQIIDPIEFRIALPIPVGEIVTDTVFYDSLKRPAAVFFSNPADTISLSVHWSHFASQIIWDQMYNQDGLRYVLGVGLEEFRSHLVRIALTPNFEEAKALKAQAIALLHPLYLTG
jgi:hypothetical protein